MAATVLTPANANLQLTILNSEAESVSSSDFYAWLKARGLSDEVAIRLKRIAEITAEIGKRVINVGKMILVKIIEFLKAYPTMAIGMAIGAAFGALVGMVPFLGPILAPIATVLGVTCGALAGYQLDKAENGRPKSAGLMEIGQDVIEIATAFFKLLADIFNTALNEQVLRGL